MQPIEAIVSEEKKGRPEDDRDAGARRRNGEGPAKVSEGEIVYRMDGDPCSGVGIRWSEEELNAAIVNRVTAVVFDDEGKANNMEILEGVMGSDFNQDKVRQRILKDRDRVENWRAGEAIAEAYLTDHRSCYFPWPDGRDEKKRGSSLPGADLVGIGTDENGDCLAFGETKTSEEGKHPPRLMSGSTGLEKQLMSLRDCTDIRDELVLYLCTRAKGAPWRSRFEGALRRYHHNSSDVHLFGFLVRDVEPHRDDLRRGFEKLAEDCPQETRVEIIALYLPCDRLKGIGKELIAKRSEERG